MRESQGTVLPDVTDLPSNVEVVQHDGSPDEWLEYISCCKLLVVPVTDICIYAEGVSTYLQAMALGKCVVTTLFEGTRDIIDSGEALLVPRGDVNALRATIVKAWEDDEFRTSIARAGKAYADQLDGETKYHATVVGLVQRFLAASSVGASQPPREVE
jgi:glycosyltransferase involved in cell wall biosynthesis